ncbi:MAG: electron transfer flavoprotein subunit alpha/FixB family protein [Desulfobacterales bacterium]|nr:electron transfer flavoprotein subunit alpha/FixB family protein [Desulfobacterales bacterium]
MSNIGVLIEISDDGVKEANFGVLTAAHGGGSHVIYAFVCGVSADSVVGALQEYGVQKVVELAVDGVDPASNPELLSAALADAINHFEIEALLGLSSASGRDILARVAALTGSPLLQDCVGIDLTSKTITKSHFSGKTVASIKVNSNPFMCSLRPNTIEAQTAPCTAEVLNYDTSAQTSGKLVVKEVKQSQSKTVDLTEAAIIITGGRPIAAPDNYKILQECADLLGAAVGASRAAVDAGFAPHSMQVGQTGKTVSPKLYIGCGLSGSVQHFAGMKTSKIIVAINTDKDAPIFGKCDYGIIGDLFEVVPALTEVLKEQG